MSQAFFTTAERSGHRLFIDPAGDMTSARTGSWGDQGDGTYRNPILNADYPDTAVVQAGDTYYMISSKQHKVSQHGGGVTTGTIVRRPDGGCQAGRTDAAALHFADIAPTLGWTTDRRKETERMTPTLTRIAYIVLITIALGSAPGAGELDVSQQKWFNHYKKQANVPDPAEMLLNTDLEPDLGEGFSPLFNGTDLTGWTTYGGTSPFGAENGCIVATCKPGSPSTYLCTDREDFGDFIFTVDIKWEVETNSGVMFRAGVRNGKTVFGPQAEMEPFSQNREWSGGIYGQSCGGWYYPLWLKAHAEVRDAQVKGDWNRLTILCRGNAVKTWLNGVPAAHWQTEDHLKGRFGLQMHKGRRGKILWRDPRVRELTNDAP